LARRLRLSPGRAPPRATGGRGLSRRPARRGRARENSCAGHETSTSLIIDTVAAMCRLLLSLALLLPLMSGPTQAQLRGHGGPARALAISPDGTQSVSGSFDTSAIRWSLARNAAEQVLRFHDGAVNAVVFLRDGRIASSGEDARIAIWRQGEPQPA